MKFQVATSFSKLCFYRKHFFFSFFKSKALAEFTVDICLPHNIMLNCTLPACWTYHWSDFKDSGPSLGRLKSSSLALSTFIS